MMRRVAAELMGTGVLVAVVVGSGIMATSLSTDIGIDLLINALATVAALGVLIWTLGPVSGAHFNPAVTIGVAVAKRFEWKDVPAYVITQVVAGLVAGLALWGIASGQPGFEATGNMAANGYGEHSPGLYSLAAVFIAEVLLTAVFLYVILGATDTRAPAGFAPIAIGLALTLIHLISIPISNTSVNPARSTGVAFFNGNGAVGQLWVFWLAPIIGAAIAGATFHLITGVDRRDRDISGEIDPVDREVAEGVDPDAPR